jgi:penicillin-binding protein 2
MTHHPPGGQQHPVRDVMVLVSILFGILALRLFYLQVTTSAEYARESDENRIAQKRVKAPRGVIYARGGEMLARNRVFYTVATERTTRQEFETIVEALKGIVGTDRVATHYRRSQRAVRLTRDIDFRTVSVVEEQLSDQYPELFIEIESQRDYPYGATAAHVLGYMGVIQEENLASLQGKGYLPDDYIGRTGLERVHEDELHGRDGIRFVEVDAGGRVRREIPGREQAADPGQDLHLTIDLRVQRAAEKFLPDTLAGAVVALDPQTGAVLAMASKPAFDPNVFVSFSAQGERQRVLQSETNLLNRAIRGRYPPGSTLKMVAAIAGLETGVTDTLSAFAPCSGTLKVGSAVFHCMHSRGHGALNLQGALEVSCNIYFLHLAQHLGFDTWYAYASRFGFGQTTGLEMVPGESAGLLPSRAYFKTRGGYSQGHLMNLAIGQGSMLVTPLQMARYVSAICNGGYLVTPHLCGATPTPQRIAGVSDRTFETVKRAMRRVVQGDRGTGRRVRLEGVDIAGKSGTAQGPREDDDAWFVAFAPYYRPTIAVAVIVEAGGSGGAMAGPVAREVIKAYLLPEEQDQGGEDSTSVESAAAAGFPDTANVWALH